MYDGTPWGMIHKQKELNLKHAELIKVQSELDSFRRNVKKFMHNLEQESKKLHANGKLDDVGFRKIQRMIDQF